MNVGDVVTIVSEPCNTRFFKGDKVRILGYTKTYNQYYVQRADGQVCGMVKKEDFTNDKR